VQKKRTASNGNSKSQSSSSKQASSKKNQDKEMDQLARRDGSSVAVRWFVIRARLVSVIESPSFQK
jgi:hypothetical protein